MVIELSQELEAALKEQASACGMSPDGYVREVLEKTLVKKDANEPTHPLQTGYGALAKYGPAPSAEEIDEVRREMWHGFGENF